MEKIKVCRKCLIPLTEENKVKKKKQGNICHECFKKYMSEYRREAYKNPKVKKKLRLSSKKYRETHKEKCRERDNAYIQEYRIKNRRKILLINLKSKIKNCGMSIEDLRIKLNEI